jgi:hypothetical protein
MKHKKLTDTDKPIVVNVGVNHWYPKGSRRLKGYLDKCMPGIDYLIYEGEYPASSPSHEMMPYALKIHAIEQAIKRGYSKIIWMDCSIVINKPFHDLLGHDVFMWDTGLTIGETTNDNCLQKYMMPNEGLFFPESATTFVIFDIHTQQGLAFWELWQGGAYNGAFAGSRQYNPAESTRKEFKYHRQDQSAASCTAYWCNIKPHSIGEFADYNYPYPYYPNRNLHFLIAGGANDEVPDIL